jgi:hypothetical protein
MASTGDAHRRDEAWSSEGDHVPGAGLLTYGSIVMFIAGTFHIISGMSAIEDESFLNDRPNYVFDVSAAAWGWLHMLCGAVLIAGAFALLGGARRARSFAVTVAALSALGSFLSVPYEPVMSAVMVLLAASVIIAVAAYEHPKDLSQG